MPIAPGLGFCVYFLPSALSPCLDGAYVDLHEMEPIQGTAKGSENLVARQVVVPREETNPITLLV